MFDVVVIAAEVEDPDVVEAQLRHITICLKPESSAKDLIWELARLFPGCAMHVERITFAAPVARIIARVSPRAATIANQSDLLATHYLALISKSKEEGHA